MLAGIKRLQSKRPRVCPGLFCKAVSDSFRSYQTKGRLHRSSRGGQFWEVRGLSVWPPAKSWHRTVNAELKGGPPPPVLKTKVVLTLGRRLGGRSRVGVDFCT